MRKLIVVFLVLLSFPMTSLALSPGNYMTLQNLNVRSSMRVTNNRIDNIKRKIRLKWFPFTGTGANKLKNYRKAYIYCTVATVMKLAGTLEIKSVPVSDVLGLSAANNVLEDLTTG